MVRVYVNLEEILKRAQEYIEERSPNNTIFEGAATSDPIPLEYLTGSLKRAVEFFAKQPLGRFRFVTKYADVDSLLTANHQGHTEVRFSLNTEHVISEYEKATARAKDRLKAAGKVAAVGYPIGFLIAPIIIYQGWQEDYYHLIKDLWKVLPSGESPKFELITHRFTPKAKSNILKVFPNTTLSMEETERTFKYGQFGYGKYVYTKDQMASIRKFFYETLAEYFPASEIVYLV